MQINGNVVNLDEQSSLLYCANYLGTEAANKLLQVTLTSTDWVQSKISLFGKRISIPRLNAWYGEYPYSYSGTSFAAQDPPPLLNRVQQQLIADTGLAFNSVLLNLYRNGEDSMGWHSDNEKSLGDSPQIASISLGAERRFVVRNRQDKRIRHTLQLDHGSLLLMLGSCQQDWQHCLPKMKRIEDRRVNLTFRRSFMK